MPACLISRQRPDRETFKTLVQVAACNVSVVDYLHMIWCAFYPEYHITFQRVFAMEWNIFLFGTQISGMNLLLHVHISQLVAAHWNIWLIVWFDWLGIDSCTFHILTVWFTINQVEGSTLKSRMMPSSWNPWMSTKITPHQKKSAEIYLLMRWLCISSRTPQNLADMAGNYVPGLNPDSKNESSVSCLHILACCSTLKHMIDCVI